MCCSSFSLFWVQLFVMSENTSPFTAYYYLKNDFVGQKFLEFILGEGMKVNSCWNKPGGHSILPKAILGKGRHPWPPAPSHPITLVMTIKMSPRGQNPLWLRTTVLTNLSRSSKNVKVCIICILRCCKVRNKWNFAILETSSLNIWDKLSWLCKICSKAKYNVIQPHRGEQ